MMVTVFQVKRDMTREHGFMGLDFMVEHGGKDRKAYDMSVYEVVFGEMNVDGYVFFPRTSEEVPAFFFDVTNNPSRQQERETLVDYFKFKGRSVSVSDIIKVDDKFFYCDSFGWEEVTPKKGSVPHWIHVGMGASGSYFSDMTPFEVIKVTPSGKTVTIREMDWKIIKGTDFDGTAEYEYTSNPNGRTYTVRKQKSGAWKTPCGMRIGFGNARRYYDPHF
jgi:hypothetical protein